MISQNPETKFNLTFVIVPFVTFIFDIRKYKVLPSSSELPDTGCKERKLRRPNIEIKIIPQKTNKNKN